MELTTFRRWLKRRYKVYLEDELHSAELIRKSSRLAASLQNLKKYERLAILRHHADQLSRMADLSLINIVVDKTNPKLVDKEAVFYGAWRRLFQRFENTIHHQNFPGYKNASERGIVFPDNTDGERIRRYLNKMRQHNPIKLPGQTGGF